MAHPRLPAARLMKRQPRPAPTEADWQELADAVYARLVAKGDLRRAEQVARLYGARPAATATESAR